jgi:hypothetical protein
MSTLKVNTLKRYTGTTITIGESGDTITITSGATLSGSGASLTALDAGNISAGTLAIARGGTGSTSTTYCDLTANVTGTLPTGKGGTGSTSTTYASLTTNVSGTLPVGNGGTNLTSYAVGDVIYASGTTTLSKLAKPGTPADEVLTFATGGSAPSWVALSGGTSWQSVVTGSTMTAVAGEGYPIDTTSNACTVTLPAGSVGDTVELVDYAGTWDTNAVTLAADGSENIEGATDDRLLEKERLGVRVVYVDATQGWMAVTAANEGTQAMGAAADIEWLVIAGGGGGAGNHYSGAGGAGGYRTNFGGTKLTLTKGNQYTATVGAGGSSNATANGSPGVDSSLAGTGITTITSTGGGYGGVGDTDVGGDGGSGGGGGGTGKVGGSGNTPSTDPSQGNDGGTANNGGGGGGGIGGAGGAGGASNGGSGGAGVNNSITGAAVGYAGGGGGAAWNGTVGVATHGGGNGGQDVGAGGCIAAAAGTNGTGGGGGGSCGYNYCSGYLLGGAGGDGIVIIRIATAAYTGTTTGSPTITTDGTDTVIKFLSTGTYTA